MEGQSCDGEAIVSGNFCGVGQGLDGGGQSRDGDPQVPPLGRLTIFD